MGRLIENVYYSMKKVIPLTEKEFHAELREYIQSLWNIAPEVRQSASVYIPYSAILLKYIPDIDNLTKEHPQWMLDCRDIFADKLKLYSLDYTEL